MIWGLVAEAAGYGLVYVWAMVPVILAMGLYLKPGSFKREEIQI